MSEFKIGDKVGFLGMEGRLVYTSDLACTIIVPGAGFSTISDPDWKEQLTLLERAEDFEVKEQRSAGFQLTAGTGFRITFENGYAVSVQFGYGHYCDNRDTASVIGYNSRRVHPYEFNLGCANAEVAVINPEGHLIGMPDFGGDTVGTDYTPDMVYKLMKRVRKMGK